MYLLLAAHDSVTNLAQITDPGSVAPPGVDGFVTMILGWLKWATGLACIAGLLCVAIMMGIGIRGRSETAKNALSHAPWVFGAAILSGSAAALINGISG